MHIEEFHYRVRHRVRGGVPGSHRSRHRGSGVEFREFVALHEGGDPRRLDLRASLRDPMRRLMVRLNNEPSILPVFAVCDVSASMGFGERVTKLSLAASFVASLGYSAFRTGDPFGLIACDEGLRTELLQPLTYARGAGMEMANRLRGFDAGGSTASGLLHAARLVGKKTSLVFLVSDFFFDRPFLERLLDSFSKHVVVPTVISSSAEFDRTPAFGITRVRDLETGVERTVFMRPGLRDTLRRNATQWRQTLTKHFALRGMRPLMIRDVFCADDVTRHFFQ